MFPSLGSVDRARWVEEGDRRPRRLGLLVPRSYGLDGVPRAEVSVVYAGRQRDLATTARFRLRDQMFCQGGFRALLSCRDPTGSVAVFPYRGSGRTCVCESNLLDLAVPWSAWRLGVSGHSYPCPIQLYLYMLFVETRSKGA